MRPPDDPDRPNPHPAGDRDRRSQRHTAPGLRADPARRPAMTRRHQLETTLRALKLSGMLDTLEARLAQATAGEFGHLEFLQVLCEDEITRRDAASLARRVRHARFEEATTIEDFDFAYNPK